MNVFAPTTSRLARLALIAGAMLALAPVAQADSGFVRNPDAIDRALVTQQAERAAALDARERAMQTRLASDPISMLDARERALLTRPGLASIGRRTPDAFERALRAHEENVSQSLTSMPDVLERTAAAGPAQYLPPTTTASGFDWSDFGIGAGVGIGFMLVIVGLGAGVLVVRNGRVRVTSA
ncbi:MAG: hypothetical protein A2Y55_12470 [Actinobacteria bacterium RBG_16_68_12]|nr:MAG: hypothetical protein A2Y55_12470 [Actinobacteria bacterium RBG_16_68_12]